MNLTVQQREYLPVVEWIVDNSISRVYSGRTFLFIYAILKTAIKYPNTDILLINHIPIDNNIARKEYLQLLRIILNDEEFKGKNFSINKMNRTVRYNE